MNKKMNEKQGESESASGRWDSYVDDEWRPENAAASEHAKGLVPMAPGARVSLIALCWMMLEIMVVLLSGVSLLLHAVIGNHA